MADPRFDLDALTTVYAAADDLDFEPFSRLLADGVLMHLPGVAMELAGIARSVRALRMMYVDLKVRQRPVRVERLGPFVVVFVAGSSSLRGRLDAIHVMRLDESERVAEFWGITTPLRV